MNFPFGFGDNGEFAGDHLEFIRRIQGFSPGSSHPGDDDYPQYPLPPLLSSERMFLSASDNNPNKERAFVIANKAQSAIAANKIEDAKKMAKHALSLDPTSIDAWRSLIVTLNCSCDGDTVICALRELLHYAKIVFHESFINDQCMFYNVAPTRAYIRLLIDIGNTALESDQLDIALYSYEESLRLNRRDNIGARSTLLAIYMIIVGRRIAFPNYTPIRTVDHVNALINLRFEDDTVFEDNNTVVKWTKLILAYHNKDPSWKAMAQQLHNENELMFKAIYGEVDIESIPPESNIGFRVGSLTDDVRCAGPLIQKITYDWPIFLKDLYKLIPGKEMDTFKEYLQDNTVDIDHDLSPEYKQEMSETFDIFLEQGRKALSNKQWMNALTSFTFAKRAILDQVYPEKRWYIRPEFPVVSNRAAAGSYLSLWELVRIDTRYTLVIKPDHQRSYWRLPQLAKELGAKQLIPEFTQIAEDCKNNPQKSTEEWNQLAKIVIGLTSLTSFILASVNELTPERREEAIALGIDDLYEPVSVSPDLHPVLPYLTNNDIQILE